MDRFQDKAVIEAPGEGAEVARQMFSADDTMRGPEAVCKSRNAVSSITVMV